MKKWLILLLCLTSSLTMLSGCSQVNDKEYGTIQDVDISNAEDSGYEEDKIFTEAKDNLGYEYVEINSKRAQMKFMVPKTWTIKTLNQRFIIVQAPQDDPKLPGVTLNIQHGLNALAEFGNNTPSEFEELFSAERKNVTYKIDGADYYQSYMGTPSRVVAHNEITSEENNICMCIYEDAPMFRYRLGNVPPYKCTAFYSYVKWKDLPHCFSLVCDSKYADTAEKLLTYITSTIKLSKAKIGSTKQETISDITFTVPKEFEKIKADGKEYLLSSTVESNYFGGSAICVVDLDEEKIDSDFMNRFISKDGQGSKLCKEMLGMSYQYVIGYCGEPEKISIGGRPADLLFCTCDIFGTGAINDPMQPTNNGYLLLYCFDSDNGGKRAVMLITGTTPEEAVVALVNMIEERTKI